MRQEILERLVRVLHARDLDPKEEFELRDQRDDDACPRACVRWVLVRYNKAAIRLGMRRPTISPRNMPPHTHTHTRTRAVARNHDGVRDVVDDGAEAEDAEPDLEHAGQEAELERGRQAHGLGVALWGFGVERRRASGLLISACVCVLLLSLAGEGMESMDGWMRCGAAVAIGGIYRQMIENYIGEPLVERAGGHHGDERGVGRAGLAGGAHHLHSFFWGGRKGRGGC